METALLLNQTKLGPNHIGVTGEGAVGQGRKDAGDHAGERESDDISQEEKPRARILAEYLAHGYVVGDAALERAIELDTTHGVSNRFLNTIQNLDQKYHATDRAKAADTSYGISERANSFLTGITTYFEKASNNPTGQKVVDFYTASSRQVQDIHKEARRLADLKKSEHGGSAYKAAGLERYFGKEKEKTKADEKAQETEPLATADSGAAAAQTTAPNTKSTEPAVYK